MEKILKKIKQNKPVVHTITNSVTINDCANALLAIGASPIMARHIEETYEVTSGADAFVCNLGATYDYEAICNSIKAANQKDIPVVLDPVGTAASTYRRNFAIKILNDYHINGIRGNYSEIVSLLKESETGNGLDNKLSASELPLQEIQQYASEHQMVILASGKTDYIFGDQSGTIFETKAGDPMMSCITGSGCMLSTLMAAVLSADRSAKAIAKLSDFYGNCGSKAAEKVRKLEVGSGTFRTLLIDEIYKGCN